jgi:tRNA threonylcarbamoyladenosine biosynthesis protein TsaE
MVTYISKGPEETFALGRSWGRAAAAGWVVALCGDLGTGKTLLTKGIAAGLGSSDPVHSPTFALLNEYGGGRLWLYHMDLYRLTDAEALFRAGLDEYLWRSDGVTVVEWADRWLESGGFRLGGPMRRVRIDVLGNVERRIAYEDCGP